MNYKKDLIFAKSAYIVSSNEKLMRAEILKNGPVVAGFNVYSDFFFYKSGKENNEIILNEILL